MQYLQLYNFVFALILAFLSSLCVSHAGYVVNPDNNIEYKLCTSQTCKDLGNEIIKSIDQSIDPCDNFYEHACRGWIENHPVPESLHTINHLDFIGMRLRKQLKEILTKNETSDSETLRKMRAYYRSCVDLAAIDARGLSPLETIVSANGDWPLTLPSNNWLLKDRRLTLQKIHENYAQLVGSSALFIIDVVPCSQEAGKKILELKPPIFPTERERTMIRRKRKRNTYDSYIAAVAKELATLRGFNVSFADINEDLTRIYRFEAWLHHLYSSVLKDDIDNGTFYRVMTIAQVQNTWNEVILGYPEYEIDWLGTIRSTFYGTYIPIHETQEISFPHENFLQSFGDLLKLYTLRTIVNYVHWHGIDRLVSYTNKEIQEVLNVMNETGHEYVNNDELRSIFCIDNHIMPEGLSYAWMQQYFDNDYSRTVKDMAFQIRTEIKRQFDHSAWMDDSAKLSSKEIINNMRNYIEEPDWQHNSISIDEYYDDLVIGPDFFENVVKYNRFKAITTLQKLWKYNNRCKDIEPHLSGDVTTFYGLDLNSLTYPATIFQLLFFDVDRPMVFNYGHMGVTIAREIAKVVGIEGIKYNEIGNKEKWWSDLTIARYAKKVQCLIDQYNDYTLFVDDTNTTVKIDGNRTANENFADNVGFTMALKAYLSYKREHNFEDVRIPLLQNYTDMKLFFYSSGYTYCSSEKPDATETVWKHSVRSPYANRINGAVSNMREFSEAFNCPSGSPMNPVKKCVLWDDKLCESKICEEAGDEIVKSIDQSVDPCNNFYKHACGGWIANHPIPEGQLATSQVRIVKIKIEEQLRDTLRKNTTSDTETLQKVIDYYNSCVDLSAIEARGLAPLESIVFANGGWPITLTLNKWRLEDQNLTLQIILQNYAKVIGCFALLDIDVVPYSFTTDKRFIKLEPSISPRNRQRSFISQRQKRSDPAFVYDSYILDVVAELASLRKFNVSPTNIHEDLTQMDNFEFALNELYSSIPSDTFDNGTLYRVTTIADVQKTWNIAVSGHPEYAINWLETIDSAFVDTDIVIDETEQLLVPQENIIAKLADLLKSYPLRTIVNYVHWHAIDRLISHTNKKMRTITNKVFRNQFGDANDDDQRSTFCIDHHIMPEGLFYAWLRKYMGQHISSPIIDIISQIQVEMKRQLDLSTWLDDEAKFRLIDNIKNMMVFFGYLNYYDEPGILDEFYSELKVGPDYFQNLIYYNRFRRIILLKKLRTPHNRYEARLDVFSIKLNAYNDLERNSISFPAMMFQMPFFHAERSMALNYGSIGAAIGNEISNRLDIHGIMHEEAYDNIQWPFNSTVAKYNNKAKCFVEQYDRYTLLETVFGKLYIDGEKTLKQNIADNNGFAVALRAYLSYKKKHNPEHIMMPGLQSYTDEMLFFYSLSNYYCESESTEATEHLWYDKMQSPAKVRINGVVSNMREFSKAFNCPSGSPMNPVKKCILWDDQLCESQICEEAGNKIVKNIDESVDPCNNFYKHVCVQRPANHPLTQKQSAANNFNVINMKLQDQLREMLQKNEMSESETQRKVISYYRSCEDLAAIDARGLSPLESIVLANGGWPLTLPSNKWDLEEQNLTMEKIHKNYVKFIGSSAFFDLIVVPHKLKTGVNLLKLRQPMTSIKKERGTWSFTFKYVLAVAIEFARLRGSNVSSDNINDEIIQILIFEYFLHELYDGTLRNDFDYDSLYRVRTIAQVQSSWNTAISGRPEYAIDWLETIRSAFDGTGVLIDAAQNIEVPQKFFVEELAGLLKRFSLRTIVNYIHWHAIDGLVPYTNKKMRQISNELFKSRYGYMNNDDQRFTFCIDHHKMHLGLLYAYRREYVNKNISESVIGMISQIQEEMKRLFDQSTWINYEAKFRLKEKLDNMMMFIKVPDYYDEPGKFDDFYSELVVGPDYFENVVNYNRFRARTILKKLLVPYSSYEADLEILFTEANAYEDMHLNILRFPVAMLQMTYFHAESPMVLNYGNMGAAIGYEISHGLGIEGELYDDIRNDKQLWLKPTIDRYNEKAKCFVDQYSNYTLDEDLKLQKINIDGEKTLGQNIADNIGFATTLSAYHSYKTKQNSDDIKIPVLQNYTDEMLFFYAFGNRYCGSETPEVMKLIRSPTAVMINAVVSNMREFSDAFKCPSGSPMNPVKKCILWD